MEYRTDKGLVCRIAAKLGSEENRRERRKKKKVISSAPTSTDGSIGDGQRLGFAAVNWGRRLQTVNWGRKEE